MSAGKALPPLPLEIVRVNAMAQLIGNPGKLYAVTVFSQSDDAVILQVEKTKLQFNVTLKDKGKTSSHRAQVQRE